VFAQAFDLSSASNTMYSVPTSAAASESEYILNTLFGQIGDLGQLTSTNSVMGVIFRLLNISVAFIGGMIASITVYQGVVQTAAQGVFMGKKGSQSAYFTGLRTIGGLALVMPVYGGYSVLQYIVMSIALSSIGLANGLAGGILKQMDNFNPSQVVAQVLQLPSTNSADDYNTAVSNSGLSQASVQSYYKKLARFAACAVINNELKPIAYETGGEIKLRFPANSQCAVNNDTVFSSELASPLRAQYKQQTNLILGSLYNYFLSSDLTSEPNEEPSFNVPRLTSYIQQLSQARALGFVSNRGASASNTPLGDFVYDWVKFPYLYQAVSMGCSEDTELDLFNGLMNGGAGVCSSASTPQGFSNFNPGLSAAGTDAIYNQISGLRLSPASQASLTDASSTSTSSIRSKVQNALQAVSWETLSIPSSGNIKHGWEEPPELTGTFFGENEAVKNPLKNVLQDSATIWLSAFFDQTGDFVKNPALKLGELAAKLSGNLTLFMFTLSRDVIAFQTQATFETYWLLFTVRIAKDITLAYYASFLEYAWDMFYCLIPFAPNPSFRVPFCAPTLIPLPPPIFIMVNPAWVAQIITSLVMITSSATAYSIAVGVFEAIEQPLQLAWQLTTQTAVAYQYMGIIIAAVSPVMVMTSVLSIWVPMLPSLTFFIAIIGWVLAVTEAMVAFPLTALGMTFPQGHDFLGSAQQSLILLLSLFIRAPLIVMGFYIGMLLLSVGVGFLLKMSTLMLNLVMPSGNSMASAVITIMAMMFLLYITATLVAYCLSASYKIPSMVIRWVGAQADTGSEQQSIQRVYALLNQQQGSALSSVQQSAQGSEQSSKSVAGSV
jgi:hypothetical protein